MARQRPLNCFRKRYSISPNTNITENITILQKTLQGCRVLPVCMCTTSTKRLRTRECIEELDTARVSRRNYCTIFAQTHRKSAIFNLCPSFVIHTPSILTNPSLRVHRIEFRFVQVRSGRSHGEDEGLSLVSQRSTCHSSFPTHVVSVADILAPICVLVLN